MKLYFVRHTDSLLVRDEDLKKLWDEDRIAIHYPDKASGRSDEDSRSLDPAEYKARDNTAISRLVELARDGGHVWAESFVSEDKSAKVGCVEPGTEIVLRDARWYLRGQNDVADRQDGYPVVLKTVKLSKVRSVPRREQVGLRAGIPQQGTISYWHVGERLADSSKVGLPSTCGPTSPRPNRKPSAPSSCASRTRAVPSSRSCAGSCSRWGARSRTWTCTASPTTGGRSSAR